MPAQNLPSFISFGDDLENPISLSKEERYDIHARNMLRHMIRGVPLCIENNQSHDESPLAADEIINTLVIKKDDKLLYACRKEIQNILNNAFDFLQSDAPQELKDRCELFLSYFLSSYPFMDPQKNEPVVIPTKIDGIMAKGRLSF